MADFEIFQVGDLAFPLDAVPSNSALLGLADPGLAVLLNYLEFEINRKLGDFLSSATGRKNPPVATNIRKVLWLDPILNVEKADQVAFPLFCLWRGESKFSSKSLNWRQDANVMGFSYSLPAMALEQALRVAPVLHAIVTIINESLYQGFDPAYNNGARILGEDTNITSARCTDVRYGVLQLGDLTDTHFQSVFGKLEVIEQTRPNEDGLTTLTGTDFTVTDMKNDADLPYDDQIPKDEMASEHGP